MIKEKEPEKKQFKDEEDVYRYFEDQWDRMNPYGKHKKHGQLKDPKEIAKFKQDLALKLLVPSLGARRRRVMSVDNYPQLLSISNALTVANTFRQVEVGVPINRLSVEDDKAWVIEISKIQVSAGLGVYDLGATEIEEILAQLSTSSLTAIDLTDPTVFWFHRAGVIVNQVTAASIGTAVFNPESIVYDLQVNGRGLLIATDTIFCALDSTNAPGVITLALKVYYKYVQIGIAEYVGIVQGQLQT